MFFGKKNKKSSLNKQTGDITSPFNNNMDEKQSVQQKGKVTPKTENLKPISDSTEVFIKEVKDQLHSPADLIIRNMTESITIIYIDNLVKEEILNGKILPVLQDIQNATPDSIHSQLPLPQVNVEDRLNECIKTMLTGAVIIHVAGYAMVTMVIIPARESRGLSAPENESQVIGSQVGFNESLSTNISLVRRFILSPDLSNEQLKVGNQTNTSLSILYIDGVASEQNVNTVRQRIQTLDIEDLIDSAELAELIDDSSLSIFPQMLLTERPDRFCDGLLSGKIGVLVDGSSMGILCPYAFIEFFQSREDRNLRWPIATFVRWLRFVAIFISIFLPHCM